MLFTPLALLAATATGPYRELRAGKDWSRRSFHGSKTMCLGIGLNDQCRRRFIGERSSGTVLSLL